MSVDENVDHRALESAEGPEIQAVSDWLIAEGLGTPDPKRLHAELCERLVGIGIPLWRGFIGVRTLHPRFEAVNYVWRRGDDPRRWLVESDAGESQEWRESPFSYMIDASVPRLRRRLADGTGRPHFPVLDQFRAEGATDYYAHIVAFDIGERTQPTGIISSWISDAPGGFSDRDLAILARLLPRYALVAKALLARQIAINVLTTYVGPSAGRRVLAGEIRRGHMETIRAVLVYVDLRGFTEFSDRTPREKIAETLDDYFDAIVAPAVERGGEVLKFLGDGCLITFNLERRANDSVCSDALAAAIEMLARVRMLNELRRVQGEIELGLDVALHLGDVLYGNVGAADRLDFTVLGPAVNEASRIEGLCKDFDRSLLVSEAFARAATYCAGRLESVGHHTLRGVSQPQEIFALKENV